jgi:hypothetical protein
MTGCGATDSGHADGAGGAPGHFLPGGASNAGGSGAGANPSSGGTVATGGAAAGGGAPAAGGTAGTVAQGGATAAGGIASTGGTPSTGGVASAGTSGGGAGGGSGGGGSPSSGGAGGATAGGCRPKFASGLNVAWFNFAGDVPNPNISRFTQLFHDTYQAGGRVVRWWFHTNGTKTPGYDSGGSANTISAANVADVKKILDAAQAEHVAVALSLWSFDMLQGGQSAPLDDNMALLTTDAKRQAYIDRVLVPLVDGLKGHPGLYAWEIFNEPEGMTTQHGWTQQNGGRTVDESVVQKCVNWFADAIHAADPNALVTNGAWQFAVNATVSGYQNAYSDTALKAAGGRAKGTLDFYEVHYYDNWNGSQVVSPFTHPASYWNVDKPIVIGEFWAIDTNGVAAANLYTTLFDGGYSGAWAWQYANDDGGTGKSTRWPAMQVPMQNLYAKHAADLDCPAQHALIATAPASPPETRATNAAVVQPLAQPLGDEAELMERLRKAKNDAPAVAEALARDGNRRFPNGPGAAERGAALVRAIARQGRLSEARGEAEAAVRNYADSPWALEVEQQTGAHPRRDQ